ncbi:MAG: PIN domain-containing protein [Thiolinea sp.]
MADPKVFFDTNILLYLLSADEAKADRAESLLANGGIISVQVLNEFTAVAFRKLKLTYAEISEILTTVSAVCEVKDLTVETHRLGLSIAERYGFSFYDSVILSAAVRADCTVLYSEDMQSGQSIFGTLTIKNPF